MFEVYVTIAIRNKCDWQCCCTETLLCFFFPALPPRLNSCGLCLLSQPYSPSLAQSVSGPHLGPANNWKAILIFCSGETEGNKFTFIYRNKKYLWNIRFEHLFWLIVSMLLAGLENNQKVFCFAVGWPCLVVWLLVISFGEMKNDPDRATIWIKLGILRGRPQFKEDVHLKWQLNWTEKMLQ